MRAFEAKASLIACALLVCSPARGEGEDKVEACAAAGEQGQLLRIKGKFREARTKYMECVRDGCPSLVQKDCAQFLSELDAAMPSIVVAAHDSNGTDLTDVRVQVDSENFLDRLDGKAVPIDPGAHTFRFEAPGLPVVTKSFVVREGEKSRLILVTIEVPGSKKVEVERPTPTSVWIALGVGTVALGSFAYFGLAARRDFDDLRSSCGGNCASSDVDRVKRKALIADVSLGISAISFGLATFFYLARPETPRAGALDLRATVGREGGTFVLSGVF